MTRIEFAKRFPSPYSWLLRNDYNLLDKYLPKQHSVWTKEKIKNIAKKYNSMGDWKNNDPNSYASYRRYGNKKEFCSHMKPKHTMWTVPLVIKEAKKYNTKKEWELNSLGSYSYAQRNKLIKSYTKHMVGHAYRRKIKNLDTGKMFENLTEAGREISRNKSSIHASIKRKIKCAGYRWAYCDENGKILNERTKK